MQSQHLLSSLNCFPPLCACVGWMLYFWLLVVHSYGMAAPTHLQLTRFFGFKFPEGWLLSRLAGAGHVDRAHRVCLSCNSGAIGGERHMSFECAALASLRQERADLFTLLNDTMHSFFAQQDHLVVLNNFIDCLELMKIWHYCHDWHKWAVSLAARSLIFFFFFFRILFRFAIRTSLVVHCVLSVCLLKQSQSKVSVGYCSVLQCFSACSTFSSHFSHITCWF